MAAGFDREPIEPVPLLAAHSEPLRRRLRRREQCPHFVCLECPAFVALFGRTIGSGRALSRVLCKQSLPDAPRQEGIQRAEVMGRALGPDSLLPPPLRLKRQQAPRNSRGSDVREAPQGTLDDLTAWREFRIGQNAGPADLLVCSQAGSSLGKPIDRQNARHRFLSACPVLGLHRLERLTIHHGRHSFISHALAALRTLAEVRDAARHSNIATTSLYTHVATDDDVQIGNLFGFTAPPEVA